MVLPVQAPAATFPDVPQVSPAVVGSPTTLPTVLDQGDAAWAADHHARAVLARVRTLWWYGLGALWIIDGLLQAQPSMFAENGLVGSVLLPAATGQPAWIAVPMSWGIQLWQRAPALWNGSAVLLELAIGGLLLAGPRRPLWGRSGLCLSIGWGLVVWFFGEGLGGLFAGGPTYLAGAPGSVALYVLLAGVLLLPDRLWSSPRTLVSMRIGAGTLWGIGAILQLAPEFWSPLGLASVLQNTAMMPQPFGLATLDAQLVASMAGAPVVWNSVLCAMMVGMAVVVLVGRGGKAPYIVALAWLLFIWVVFQGLGMVFSNMSTDLNTPPLWALLLVPGWVAASRRGQGRATPL
jgi:hypothetical protein